MEGGSSSSSRPSSSTTLDDDDDDDQLLVDDFYFSALYDTDEIFPISDEKYAEELQLQEALYSSTTSWSTEIDVFDTNANTDTDTDTLLRNLKQKQKETGESSNSQEAYCAICMEAKSNEETFKNQNCPHSFCEDCIGRFLATKIQENISTVKCPDPKCSGVLEPHQCRSIIPKDVFDRWENALCENAVIGSKKFYCPFNDCSALLLNDEEEVIVTVSECPHCHRLFCAQCKVVWHAGVDCEEFKSLKEGERGKEDLMAMELAKNKSWRRCPTCSFYVEKVVGCSRITCRCGHQFCYGCGSSWSSDQHYACGSQ